MKCYDVVKAVKKAKFIKVYVKLNDSDGVYIDVAKSKFNETMKKSRWFLDGYGEVDAHVKKDVLLVG